MRRAEAASAASSTCICLGSTAHGLERLECVRACPTLHTYCSQGKEGWIRCLHVPALAPGMRTSILHLRLCYLWQNPVSLSCADLAACLPSMPGSVTADMSMLRLPLSTFQLRSQSVARLRRHARNSWSPPRRAPRGANALLFSGGSPPQKERQKKKQRKSVLEESRADATQLACGQHDAAVAQAPTARQGVAAGHAAPGQPGPAAMRAAATIPAQTSFRAE